MPCVLRRAASRGVTKEDKSSRFKGVWFIRTTGKWQASTSIRRPCGLSKQVFVGYHATEEQAAERVSAAAYILGDRYDLRRCVCSLCRRAW